jgi:hypothetical protein
MYFIPYYLKVLSCVQPTSGSLPKWAVKPLDSAMDYLTSEVVEINEAGPMITLKTAQDKFSVELSLAGYRCDGSWAVKRSGGWRRIRLDGKDGTIVLRKDG